MQPVLRSKGFTLIEIMLVLVVISVMASLLVLSISDNPAKQLEQEARRMQAILQLAADEALMQGVEIALARAADPQQATEGYQLLVFDLQQQQWQPLEDKPFLYHPLPSNISMEISLRSEAATPLFQQQISKLQQLGGAQQFQPLLLLLSSGEITPFDIRFSHAASSAVASLACDGVSEIELL
jgi:general secretion pathway protein H